MTEPWSIGIDLGTTYSCVAVLQHDKVEVIANDLGHRTTPSCVAFTDTERLIGEAAIHQVTRNPQNTVYEVKRIIGRPFTDEVVQQQRKLWPFKVVDSRKGPLINVQYKGEQRQFTPEEISSMVLAKMKDTAERYLGQKVTDAVVTVPAYFNNQQRAATIDAGKIAGLKIKRIINEPTAAALAYGLDKNRSGRRRVLVFDLGGGTFDVSILKIVNGNRFYVLATAGDTHLGGQDFDNRMFKYFADKFRKQHKEDLSKSARAMQKLKVACEQAKCTLSSASQTYLEIDSLYQGIDFEAKISRARFEDLCIDLFRQTLESVKNALSDAKLDKSRIDDVVLVGGSTRIPKIQQLLSDFFQGKKLNMDINPDEAVAYGAAVQAAILTEEPSEPVPDVVLRDVLPLSVGVEVGGLSMSKLIQRNTSIPTRRSETFTLGRDNQDAATVRVLEGERVLTSDNNIIGEFTLSGLQARRRDDPGIKVTFDIDADGILCVSAVDARTDKSMRITITERNGRLSKADIERMVKEAEEFRAEDDALRERIHIKNQLEGFLVKTRYAAEDALELLTVEDDELVNRVYSKTMEWLEQNTLAEKDELECELRNANEQLRPVLEKIASHKKGGGEEGEASGSNDGAAPGAKTGGSKKAENSDDSADEVMSLRDAVGRGDSDTAGGRRKPGLGSYGRNKSGARPERVATATARRRRGAGDVT